MVGKRVCPLIERTAYYLTTPFSRVLFYDPFVPNGYERAIGVERVRSLEELFARSDILSLHCPLTSSTRNVLDQERIDLMPAGAVVVNTSRGETVSLDAVLQGLQSRKLAGAALDVLPDVGRVKHHPFSKTHIHRFVI